MSATGKTTRLQVFKPDGTFVKEAFYAKNTKGAGAVWDIVFSKDPQQRFIMLADGQNERVRVVVRETLEEIHLIRRRRASARPVLRRAQPGIGLPRGTSTRLNLRG